MIVFTEDCDRGLKRKEVSASTAGAGAGAGAGKKKEAGASERRVPLARLLPNESTAKARPAVSGKKLEEATAEKKMEEAAAERKMREGVASESADSLFKEGEMLRLREEYWEAALLWEDKLVPGALDRWLQRNKSTQAPAVGGDKKKKKKKVVRIIMPNAYIEDMIENPDVMEELSDEEMAGCLEKYRQSYAIAKIINAKNHAYQQALIAQYRAFGFAYDEKEVTDDDEKATDEAAAQS